MITFTNHIEEAHLGLWHELAAIYHTQGVAQLQQLVDTMKHGDIALVVPKVSVPESQKSLYTRAIEDCSCSKCWSKLASSDRTPWFYVHHPKAPYLRHPISGTFYPSRGCSLLKGLTKSGVAGYIYSPKIPVKEQALLQRAELEKEKLLLETSKVHLDNRKAELKLTEVENNLIEQKKTKSSSALREGMEKRQLDNDIMYLKQEVENTIRAKASIEWKSKQMRLTELQNIEFKELRDPKNCKITGYYEEEDTIIRNLPITFDKDVFLELKAIIAKISDKEKRNEGNTNKKIGQNNNNPKPFLKR